MTGAGGVGIPIILLHDAEGGYVTVELKNGYSYRGILDEAQDNFNCTIKKCTKIDPQGQEIQLEMAFVRGAQIKFIVVPEMLQMAPYFNRIKAWRKYKGNPIVGASGIDAAKSQMGKRDRGVSPMGVGQPSYGGPGYGGPPRGGGYGRPPPRGMGGYGPPPGGGGGYGPSPGGGGGYGPPPGGVGGYGMPMPPPGRGGMMPMGAGPPGPPGFRGPPGPRQFMPGMPPNFIPRGSHPGPRPPY